MWTVSIFTLVVLDFLRIFLHISFIQISVFILKKYFVLCITRTVKNRNYVQHYTYIFSHFIHVCANLDKYLCEIFDKLWINMLWLETFYAKLDTRAVFSLSCPSRTVSSSNIFLMCGLNDFKHNQTSLKIEFSVNWIIWSLYSMAVSL